MGEHVGRIIPVQPAHENVHQLPRYRRPGRNRLRGLPGRLADPAAVRCSSAARADSRHSGRTRSSRRPYIPPVVLTQFSLRNVPVALAGRRPRKVHHVDAVLDAVSRPEPVLLRVRGSELRGPATEPVSVHARAARPFLEPGGRPAPDSDLHDTARRALHAARSGLEQSRGVERTGSYSTPARFSRHGGARRGFAVRAREFFWRCCGRVTSCVSGNCIASST